MKKVLVTGANGFIGSHLTELLLGLEYRVRALAHYNSLNHWGWLEKIYPHENLEVASGDIRDPHYCEEIIKDCDLIFHLAALIAIPYSYISPDSYIETNIKGTLNICQAARKFGNKRTIITSTSEVYGTALSIPINESHPRQPQSPYSASKIGADMMALSFYNSFSLPVTIARPFNTYGPRQSARAIIPSIIIQIISGEKQIKLGDLTPTRDLVFVEDTCKGLVAISESEKTIGKEVNICTGKEVSMEDVFKLLTEILGVEANAIADKQRFRPGNSEVYRLLGDNTLLKDLTGFIPEIDLRKGLELTSSWFMKPENRNRYKTNNYNI